MLFSYINNSYYYKVIFFPLHFQSVPAGDGKKIDSINISLRTVAFTSANFHIHLSGNPHTDTLGLVWKPLSLLLLFHLLAYSPPPQFLSLLWLSHHL